MNAVNERRQPGFRPAKYRAVAARAFEGLGVTTASAEKALDILPLLGLEDGERQSGGLVADLLKISQ